MIDPTDENQVLKQLIQWGEGHPLVRAMLLTSNRAVPNAASDIFTDYDVILAVSDVNPFFASRDWLKAFGTVLVMYRDPLEMAGGFPKSGNVVQFEEGLKIDFSLWSVEILQAIAIQPELPAEFDAGYRVLLDKDGLTDGLKPPRYRAYIPKPPSQAEYIGKIEDSFLVAVYVAKYLRRDEMMAAKYILEVFMKHEDLLPMLEWHMELEHQWSVKPGLYGRRLKKRLRPDLWADLEGTYTGIGVEENWTVLYRMLDLVSKAAREVGEKLGYAYPEEMECKTRAFIQKIRALDLES